MSNNWFKELFIDEAKAASESSNGCKSDWNEEDNKSGAYIKNKPTIPTVPTKLSEFENDNDFVTIEELNEAVKNVSVDLSNYYTIPQTDAKILELIGGQKIDLSNYYDKIATETIIDTKIAAASLSQKTIEVTSLPSTGDANTIYYLKQTNIDTGETKYIKYIYVGSSWINTGTTDVNLDNYYNKNQSYSQSQIDNLFSNYYNINKIEEILGNETLPTASKTIRGAIKELKETMPSQVQADWSVTNEKSNAYIKHKPTKLSEFENDREFVTDEILEKSIKEVRDEIELVDGKFFNHYTKNQTDEKIQEELANANSITSEPVDKLPEVGVENVIYLLKQEDSDTRIQYMYKKGKWMELGSTAVDLSNHYTKKETYSSAELDEMLGDIKKIQEESGENLATLIEEVNNNIDTINTTIGDNKKLETNSIELVNAINELNAKVKLKSSVNGVPVGTILPYSGDTLIPEGFLLCKGQEVSREEFAELFEVIGITYGRGDGSTTFNLPDLRGRVPVGQAHEAVFEDSYGSKYFTFLGAKGGDVDEYIKLEHLPAHTHVLKDKTHYHDGSDGTNSNKAYTSEEWRSGNNSYADNFVGNSSSWGHTGAGNGSTKVPSTSGVLYNRSAAHKHKIPGATIKNWRTQHSVLDSSYAEVTQKSLTIMQPYLTVDYIICYTKVNKFSSAIVKWLPEVDYEKNMLVYINGEIYRATETHTSSLEFSEDYSEEGENNKWEVVVHGGYKIAKKLEEEITDARKDIKEVEYETLGERLNNIETNIGDKEILTTKDKTSVVVAVNEVNAEIINARTNAKEEATTYESIGQRLNATDEVIDTINTNIGDKTTLITENKESVVGAINEVKTLLGDINTILDLINGDIPPSGEDIPPSGEEEVI